MGPLFCLSTRVLDLPICSIALSRGFKSCLLSSINDAKENQSAGRHTHEQSHELCMDVYIDII